MLNSIYFLTQYIIQIYSSIILGVINILVQKYLVTYTYIIAYNTDYSRKLLIQIIKCFFVLTEFRFNGTKLKMK